MAPHLKAIAGSSCVLFKCMQSEHKKSWGLANSSQSSSRCDRICLQMSHRLCQIMANGSSSAHSHAHPQLGCMLPMVIIPLWYMSEVMEQIVTALHDPQTISCQSYSHFHKFCHGSRNFSNPTKNSHQVYFLH
jgi:hypothetical protein